MADVSIGANALTFSFSTQTLRVILRDGEPWFVAADVCAALTIGNPSQALARLDDDERGLISNETPSGQQEMGIVNESGLYSLILGSRKPEAKKFKKWVTSEVLPAIRKTGRYVAPAVQREAYEVLTGAQMQQIRRVIWYVVRAFRYEGVWTQAVYFYLRRVLGLPSPNPFNTSHVPTLQVELARMLAVADKVHDLIRDIECEAAKRIFRRGESVDTVVAELRCKATQAFQKLDSMDLQLPDWLRKDVAEIADAHQRYVEGLEYGGPEQPDFLQKAVNT